jgi:hypothetical protein
VNELGAGPARRRNALADGWSAADGRPDGRDTSCSVTWPGSSPEFQPASSLAMSPGLTGRLTAAAEGYRRTEQRREGYLNE